MTSSNETGSPEKLKGDLVSLFTNLDQVIMDRIRNEDFYKGGYSKGYLQAATDVVSPYVMVCDKEQCYELLENMRSVFDALAVVFATERGSAEIKHAVTALLPKLVGMRLREIDSSKGEGVEIDQGEVTSTMEIMKRDFAAAGTFDLGGGFKVSKLD